MPSRPAHIFCAAAIGALALAAAASCGSSRDPASRQGCEASCRLLLECTLGAPGAVSDCRQQCIQELERSSAACQEATGVLGNCAGGLSCDDFAAGMCADEFQAATDACNEVDGGPPDAGMDGGDAGGDDAGPPGCERFAFEASGVACSTTGCSSFTCDCTEGFPVSLVTCTPDGCLVAADCAAVCAAGLSASLDCTDTYTVRAVDAGIDSGPGDSGPGDSGPRDSGPRDSGPRDSGPRDSGPRDSGPRDAGPRDAGPRDAGPRDAGPRDAGPRDAGPRDAGMDSGPPDSGPRDAGVDACMPLTCITLGAECGMIAAGCGITRDCGSCTPPAICGLSAMPNVCVCPPAGLQGPRSPSAGASVAGIGTVAWTSTAQVTTQNDVGAVGSLGGSSRESQWLVTSGHGFTVPIDARVTGIEVSVRRRSESARIADNGARLVVGGTVLATPDRAIAGAWSSTFSAVTYGGATDLWGRTWTPAEINAAGFGFALAVQHTGSGPDAAHVDHVTITVHWDFVCP